MPGLNEWDDEHGTHVDIDENTPDQLIPVESHPAVMPEAEARDIFQEVVPGEVPEIKDNLQIVAAESARIEDLAYVLADIRARGGMCQAIAQEARRLDPNFDGAVPMAFYSKQVTATRYKVAMESVWASIKLAFKDLLAKLREMLRRFVLWLVGARNPRDNLMQKSNEQIVREVEELCQKQEYRADEIQQDMKKLADLAGVVEQEIKKGIDLKDVHGETSHVSDFDKLVAHYLYDTEATEEVRQFMEGRNPIFHDIIEEGIWTQATEDLVGLVSQSLSVMQQKTTALNELLQNKGTTQFKDQLVQARTLEALSHRLEVVWQGRKQNLQDVSTNYNHIYNAASEGEPMTHLSFQQVFARMADALATGPIKKLIASGRDLGIRLMTMEKYLDIIEVEIGNIITDGAQGMPDHSMAQPLREALDAVRQDVRDLSMIANRMNAYRSIVETMAARVTGFAYRLAVAIYRDMQATSHTSTAPEVIQEMAKQAERMRTRHLAAKIENAFK